MSNWTAAEELCSLTGAASVDEALIELGRSSLTPVVTLEVVRDWWQAGAESFCFVFTVHGPSTSETFLFKAFVPSPGTYTVAEALSLAASRTAHLAGFGVRAPRCYAAANGTAMYDYIPFTLEEALRRAEVHPRALLLTKAEDLVRRVHAAGYHPLDLIRDLRSDGEEVFMIDFGWDLGDPTTEAVPGRALENSLASLERLVQRA